MAGRKPSLRGPKLSQVLPVWTSANADLNTAIFLSFMQRLGVHDISSYLRRFAIPNFLCAVIGAAIGAFHSGFWGLIVGALLGLATPAALIWLAVTLVHVAAYLAVFCAAWAVIFYVARWILSSGN